MTGDGLAASPYVPGEGLAADLTPEPVSPNDPVFSVLDVAVVRHATTPTLSFAMHVSDPAGRRIHTLALSVQIQIDPARRTYDPETRERLVDLFGAPERWAATTHSFQWAHIDVLVPGFTGATSFSLVMPCSYDLELAAVKYFYSLPDGEVPLSFHFTGMVLYAGEHDRLQVAQVPWSCTTKWRMPIDRWQSVVRAYYPEGGWVRLTTSTLDALMARKAASGDHDFDATISGLLAETPPRREEAP